jgi:hypothetical protein
MLLRDKLPNINLVLGFMAIVILGSVITFFTFSNQIDLLHEHQQNKNAVPAASIYDTTQVALDSALLFPAVTIPIQSNINRVTLENGSAFFNDNPKLLIWLVFIAALVGVSWGIILLAIAILFTLVKGYAAFQWKDYIRISFFLGFILFILLKIDFNSVNGRLILSYDDVMNKLGLFFYNPDFIINWAVYNPLIAGFIGAINLILIVKIISKAAPTDKVIDQSITTDDIDLEVEELPEILVKLKSVKQTFDLQISILGGLIGAAVFASNIIRIAIHEAVCDGSCEIFPIEFVYAYGLIFTLLLTIVYYPSFEIYRSVTNKWIEQLIPKEDRKETAIEMGLQVSATQNFNNLLKLSTPFIASIISELVKFL